jgi:hypothetical protein
MVGWGGVFNPMSTAEVVRAVGGVLEAAAAGGADDAYRRSQMLSALSVCKLLAAEEAGRAELGEWVEQATGPILAARGEEAVDADRGNVVAARLSTLMAELRAAGDEDSRRALDALRRVLHELCDREIAALATAT